MYHKKSQFEVSLTWVFIIIVGSLFIFISYQIITKYRDSANLKYDISVENALNNLITQFGRSNAVEKNKIESTGNLFRDTHFTISCYKNFSIIHINDYTNSKNQFIKKYPTFVIDIKQKKGENSYIIVNNYKLPFFITNMLAFTSTKNLYVLDNSSKVVEGIISNFQKSSFNQINYLAGNFSSKPFLLKVNSTIRTQNLNSITYVIGSNQNRDDIKVLFQNTQPFIDNLNIYVVQIKENSNGVGNITYYWIEKKNELNPNILKKTFNFIDYDNSNSLQTMAVFSSPLEFQCAYNNLINLIKIKYKYYIIKSKVLENLTKKEDFCFNNVNQAFESDYYKSMNESLTKFYNEFKQNNFKNLDKLSSYLEQIKNSEKNIEYYSCQPIY